MYYPDPKLITKAFELYKNNNDWKNMKSFYKAIHQKLYNFI